MGNWDDNAVLRHQIAIQIQDSKTTSIKSKFLALWGLPAARKHDLLDNLLGLRAAFAFCQLRGSLPEEVPARCRLDSVVILRNICIQLYIFQAEEIDLNLF